MSLIGTNALGLEGRRYFRCSIFHFEVFNLQSLNLSIMKTATFETSKGTIVAELFPEETPRQLRISRNWPTRSFTTVPAFTG